MAHIGMAMLKAARTLYNGVKDAIRGQHCPDGLIAGPQAFGDGDDVRHDAVLGTGKQMPGAAHAGHDLIEDEQHAIAVTDLADAFEIGGHRREDAGSGANNSFRHKGSYIFRAQGEDFALELVGQSLGVGLIAFALVSIAIRIAGRDMMRLRQDRKSTRLNSSHVASSY